MALEISQSGVRPFFFAGFPGKRPSVGFYSRVLAEVCL